MVFLFPTIQQLPPTHHLFKSCLRWQIWTVLSKCPNRKNITICRIGDHAVLVENTHDFLQKQSLMMWAPSKRSSCCHRSRCTGCNQRAKSLQLYDHMYCTKWSNEEQWVQHTDVSLLHVVHIWNSQDFTLNKRDLVTYLLWKITIFHLCIDEHSGSGSLFHCHNHQGIWVLDMKFKGNKSTNFDQSFAGFPLQKVESFREKTTTTHLQE